MSWKEKLHCSFALTCIRFTNHHPFQIIAWVIFFHFFPPRKHEKRNHIVITVYCNYCITHFRGYIYIYCNPPLSTHDHRVQTLDDASSTLCHLIGACKGQDSFWVSFDHNESFFLGDNESITMGWFWLSHETFIHKKKPPFYLRHPGVAFKRAQSPLFCTGLLR